MVLWNLCKSSVNKLITEGYTIIDQSINHDIADGLFYELINAAMEKHSLLSCNSTILIEKGIKKLLPKKGIAEFDLENKLVAKQLPKLSEFSNDMGLRLALQPLLFPFNERKITTQTVKAQINFGNGACFPIHCDSDENDESDSRTVTAIFYLNKNYKPENGGFLRVYPFLKEPVNIEPVFGRMVLFSSPFLLHRVLPSLNYRLCFTIWLSVDKKVKSLQTETDILFRILNPTRRKLLQKAIFAEEWAKSIEESHGDHQNKRCALENHWADVDSIKRALSKELNFLELAENKIRLFPLLEKDSGYF